MVDQPIMRCPCGRAAILTKSKTDWDVIWEIECSGKKKGECQQKGVADFTKSGVIEFWNNTVSASNKSLEPR